VSPSVTEGRAGPTVLLINFEVACTALQLPLAVVLDVIHHRGGHVGAAEGTSVDVHFRALHQVGAALGEGELTLAELANEHYLVEHIDEVSVHLLWLEDALALGAVDVCLEPLSDTPSVEYLLALFALKSVLGYVEADLTDEWVYELFFTFNRV